MKRFCIILFAAVLVPAILPAQNRFSSDMDRESVKEVCNAVAEWQIANHQNCRHHRLDWTNGVLYRGMVEWGILTQNSGCIDFVMEIGERHGWKMFDRPYHADDICVAQAFIALYRLYGDDRMLRPAMERAWWVATHPSDAPLDKLDPVGKDERWSWCDALFMAAPVYAALYRITGEEEYVRYMDSEFKECADSLYDREDHLFYRDCKRIPLKEPNGAKQFWGRGNGWVFAAIPSILNNLPFDHPQREYYVNMFCEMADAIVATQDKNGAWHSSLLDPDSYPLPETSASAFFCYGLAWGLNSGILSGRAYRKALEKGWESLVAAVNPDGKLGYIQPVGAAPKSGVGKESTDVYGVGGFLLAGSELYRRALR